jgi:ferredoxin
MSIRATAPAATRSGRHLRVNAIACVAHGMCAELLPERIALDEWGYPLIADTEVPAELLSLARRAASACPTRALLLESHRRGK